jgi:hypothetical protein
MSLAAAQPRAVTFRPGQPPESSILREVVTPNFDQRFDACVAVTATIWAYGFRMCRTPVERREWMDAYAGHLEMLRSARVRGVCRWPEIQHGEHEP